MKYVTFRCDQNTLILNEIFMLGKRGVTIGIRAGRSVRPSSESSCVVLTVRIPLLCYSNCCVLRSEENWKLQILSVIRGLEWLEEMMLRLLLLWKL
jgi:hypothetical protein